MLLPSHDDSSSDSVPAQELSGERQLLNDCDHIVVKIGSSSIATSLAGLVEAKIHNFVDALMPRIRSGTSVVIVSSGAVAAGRILLGKKERKSDLQTRQAAASIGQSSLIGCWAKSFARYQVVTGQILLTARDISDRKHHTNAARTFEKLRMIKAVAIVNENDTLSCDEHQFGDNDRLATLVTHLTGAQALYLFSDIDAVYTDNPALDHAEKIRDVPYGDVLESITFGKGSNLGTGGMAAKIRSALVAAHSGVPVLLTNSLNAQQALGSAQGGTYFSPAPRRQSARKFWIEHTALAQGKIIIDPGAHQAIVERRTSLLVAGIVEIFPSFQKGDVILIQDTHGNNIARGVSFYDSWELTVIVEKHREGVTDNSMFPAVHADDLVPLGSA